MTMETVPPTEVEQTASFVQPAEKRLSSRYRGVCWNKKNNRWQSAINRGGRYIYLGSFVDEVEAAKAFDRAAVKLRGKSAKINFPFTDYPAEMSWHKMVTTRMNNPEVYLSNPKVLREKVDVQFATMQNQMPDTFLNSMPFPTGVGLRPSLQPYQMMPPVEPIRGRVINQTQDSAAVSHLYRYPLAEGHLIDKPTVPPTTYGGGNMMFSRPTDVNFTPVGIPLPEPVVKAEPTATEQANVIEQWLPVSNVAKGTELTLVKGHENSFVMTFMRENTTDTEVLLYDGQVMHEVGPFHSQEAAMQTSHFLLEFVNKFKSGESARNKQQEKGQPSMARRHEEIENTDGASFAEVLEGKSPFEVAIGRRPAFYSEDKEEDTQSLDHPTTFDSEEAAQNLSHISDGMSNSLRIRMGSLLDPSVSLGSVSETPSTSLPLDPQKDKPVVTPTDFSLINSGSLKDAVAILNQSNPFGLPSKECTTQPMSEPLPPIDISFAVNEDAGMAETPTMTASTTMGPFDFRQLETSPQEQDRRLIHVDSLDTMLHYGKRSLDLALDNQGCKRMKGAEELKPCAY